MRYLLAFLAFIGYQSHTYADIIKDSEELPLYVGLILGSGSSNLSTINPPLADVQSASLDESLSTTGFLLGARLFEFSSTGIYIAAELSFLDHGDMTLNTTTTTSSYYATQSFETTNLELIFGKTIRKNVAIRFGAGYYIPSVSITTDIANLQPSNPSNVVKDPDEPGYSMILGIEASVMENVSLTANYTQYSDIAYNFETLARKKADLNTFTIGINYMF